MMLGMSVIIGPTLFDGLISLCEKETKQYILQLQSQSSDVTIPVNKMDYLAYPLGTVLGDDPERESHILCKLSPTQRKFPGVEFTHQLHSTIGLRVGLGSFAATSEGDCFLDATQDDSTGLVSNYVSVLTWLLLTLGARDYARITVRTLISNLSLLEEEDENRVMKFTINFECFE